MAEQNLLFETWDGDETSIEEDLKYVLKKHGFDEELSSFLAETLEAHALAEGSTSEFISSMFVVYKNKRLRM